MAARPLFAALLGGSVLVLAPPLFAQDEAAAEALFNKGLSEMQAGKFETACPAISESQHLDPRPGTLFTLAECESKAGKIATAVAHYEDYLRLYDKMSAEEKRKQRGRNKVAQKTKSELEQKVPKLTLKLPKDAPSSVQVERDGMTLGGAALGVALPTDPGEHVIRVRVGSAEKEQRITLSVGDTKELELELPSAPSSTAAEPGESAPASAPAEPAAQDRGTGRKSKTLAFVVGGIGVAGLAVGSVTGVMVLGKKGTIDDHCKGTVCDQTGKDAADSAKSLGLVSTIGFGVGIVGIATSAVLLLSGGSSAPKQAKSAPLVAPVPGGGFIGWRGAW